jgi:hypothetical protein
MNKDIKAILGTVKFLKSYKLNQGMSKHIATATMEGTSKRGRPCKNGWTRLKRI